MLRDFTEIPDCFLKGENRQRGWWWTFEDYRMTIPTYMKAVANSQQYNFAGDQPLLGHSRPRAQICVRWSLESVRNNSGAFEHRVYYTRNRQDLGYCLNYILNIRLYTIYICMNGGDSACGLILSTVSLKLPWLVMDMARPQDKSQARPKMTAWGWLWPGLLLTQQEFQYLTSG